MLFRRSKTNSNDNRPAPQAAAAVIAADCVLEGNLSSEGEVQVCGTVRGSLRAATIVVETEGLVEGDLAASQVTIRGRVVGPIRGQSVHVAAGAHIEGDVINDTLSVESGAVIDGAIRRAGDVEAESTRREPGLLFSSYRSGSWDDGSYRPITAVRPR